MASRSELISLLTAYQPSDAAEEQYRQAMLDRAAGAHDPFDRKDFEPGHFTASAFVLHPGGRSVLLVHHARLGIWVQPGGHIDPADATPLAAAAREVNEETGIGSLRPIDSGLVDVDVHTVPASMSQPQHLHYDLRFALVAADPRLVGNAEVIAAAWVEPGDLAALGVDASVTRPVGKLFG